MAESAGERRIVSVLLVDIAGSTAISERLGPERSKFLFDEIVRLLASEIKRFGGIVAQFTGDGLYALFGVPNAHDDDAERAVRAALGMQAVLSGYAKDVAEAYGVELAARIGATRAPSYCSRTRLRRRSATTPSETPSTRLRACRPMPEAAVSS